MSWANYYRATVPERASPRDLLAAARRLVATCAVPPIDLEAKWTAQDPRALAGLAERLHELPVAGERHVEFSLLPFDPPPLLELLRRCPHEVQLAIGGAESSSALHMTLDLERTGDADEFAVSIELHLKDNHSLTSHAVRRVAVDRLRECQCAGILQIAEDPAQLIERFLAAAHDRDHLVHGLAQPGYRLVCRWWQNNEPRILSVVPERPIAPNPSTLVRLWCDDLVTLSGHLRGRGCIATAAQMSRIANPDEFLELDVEVRGDPELDAMVDAVGDDPLVAAWWCGFDDWGPAYHGVRLALNGRYQDGRAARDPGHHELIVLVDAKRRDPGAHEVAAALAARAGIALEYAGTGL